MIKIAITGSIASGKTTASKILSFKKGPLFSADSVVKKLYKKNKFQVSLSKKFNIKKNGNIKDILKKRILKNVSTIKTLEKIIHPLVRAEMKKFTRSNNGKKLLFYEIPLLIESKLMKYFDVIIFISAKKNTRLKRFIAKGGNKFFFNILNAKQVNDKKKTRLSDHKIVNEKNKKILKKNLLDILKLYE